MDPPLSPSGVLLNTTAEEIARQLTLVDWELFKAIEVSIYNV